MVHFTRSAEIAPGKLGEALAFAHKVAQHMHDVHGSTLLLLVPVGGNPSRIAWHSTYEDLAHYELLTNKLHADSAYQNLVAEAGPLFNAGSVHDEIWRTI
jgi:hypothetical protein